MEAIQVGQSIPAPGEGWCWSARVAPSLGQPPDDVVSCLGLLEARSHTCIDEQVSSTVVFERTSTDDLPDAAGRHPERVVASALVGSGDLLALLRQGGPGPGIDTLLRVAGLIESDALQEPRRHVCEGVEDG